MPQPITHMFICEQGMRGSAAGADLWSAYPNFARFGSFGPDLFYIRGTGFDTGYLEAADIMHAEGALPFYCSLLEHIKTVNDEARGDKMKAFAYGYYSHVVADVVFHPFVYRRAKDHWLDHPEDVYTAHKEMECLADNYILSKYEGTPGYQGADVDLDCHGLDGMLDADLYEMYLGGIYSAYANFPEKNISWRFDISDKEKNPIQMSYAKYNLAIGTHCYMLRKKRKNILSGRKVLPLADWPQQDSALINRTDRANWYPPQQVAGLDYNIEELLGMASKAVSAVIDASEGFFDPNVLGTSQQYFSGLNVRFLDDDYNLDTGLPSSLNNDRQNTSKDDGERFEFQAQELASRYAVM
ncbi:zinc dependent phospholipase C family protein [Fundidesulfovibrio putealis]|uniref:zinc dependent phospholipase C family protein n=1 Tax=Fundidesulfovibrio putealis TaxID=270496 RepID=UPI000489AB40|nr:zinc dependent phospholipase C family protein [Fundidesulfovibrio putealis]